MGLCKGWKGQIELQKMTLVHLWMYTYDSFSQIIQSVTQFEEVRNSVSYETEIH